MEMDLFRHDDRWTYTRDKVQEVWSEAGLLVRGAVFMDQEGYWWREAFCSVGNPAVRGLVNWKIVTRT